MKTGETVKNRSEFIPVLNKTQRIHTHIIYDFVSYDPDLETIHQLCSRLVNLVLDIGSSKPIAVVLPNGQVPCRFVVLPS